MENMDSRLTILNFALRKISDRGNFIKTYDKLVVRSNSICLLMFQIQFFNSMLEIKILNDLTKLSLWT